MYVELHEVTWPWHLEARYMEFLVSHLLLPFQPLESQSMAFTGTQLIFARHQSNSIYPKPGVSSRLTRNTLAFPVALHD